MTRRGVLTGAASAVAGISDGMTIALGGFINAGHPMVLIRELIRRGVRELTVIGSASAGLDVDLLIAAGCVRKVICPYIGAESVASIGPAFKRAAETGAIEVWECDEWMYYAGLRAAAQNLPYAPCHGLVGTSYPDVNPDLVVYDSPIGGQTLIAVPAIKPDFALLHASYADEAGNVRYADTGFGDRALHNAAGQTIVQVERIIPVETTRADPGRTAIPYADAIVSAPYGAHPFASGGFYLEDDEHLRGYLSAARSANSGDGGPLSGYLSRFVHEPADHIGYLEQVGLRRLLSLTE
jgi:glutaconate CoA-transferase subunit A